MKPTAILEMSGAYEKNPSRRRANEPDTGRGVGPAPNSWDDEKKKVWDEIVSNCAGGVFQSSDRHMMEVLCTLLLEFRKNPSEFGGRKYPVLMTLLSKCGMTPSDRSRVVVAGGKENKPKTGLASFR